MVSNADTNARKNAPFKPTIKNPVVKQTVKIMIDSTRPRRYCAETFEILLIIFFVCSVEGLRLSMMKNDSYFSRWYKKRNIKMIVSTVAAQKSMKPINDF